MPQAIRQATALHGLRAFTLKPPGMRGTELLAHMCKIRNRSIGGAKFGVSDHLGVDMTDVQRAILRPSETDLALGSIVREAALDGAQRKMPQRRMNTLGEINSHCVNGNSADRLGLIKEALTLGQSLEEVSRVQAQQKLFVIKYADSDQEDVELDELMEITGAADRAADPTAVYRRPTRASGDLAVPDSHQNQTLRCCGMTCRVLGNARAIQLHLRPVVVSTNTS